MTEPNLEPAAAPPADPEAGSYAGGLRAQRQKLLDLKPLDMLVPGYKTLVVRYRPIAWEQAEDVVTRSGSSLLEAMADELIFACAGLYDAGAPGNDTVTIRGREVQATKVAGGYGPEIADVLGFESKNAREAVLGTFGDPEPGFHPHDDKGAGLRLSAHHDIVLAWMRGAPTDDDDHGRIAAADEEFSGE